MSFRVSTVSNTTWVVWGPTWCQLMLRNSLLERKKDRLVNEVWDLDQPDRPLKRRILFSSSESRRCQPKLTQPAASSTNKRSTLETSLLGSSNGNGSVSRAALHQASSSWKGNNVVDPTQGSFNGTAGDFIMKEKNIDAMRKEEMKDVSSTVAAKCVGRFFYETGIDPDSAIRMSSLQKMLEAAIKCGTEFKIPKYNELRG